MNSDDLEQYFAQLGAALRAARLRRKLTQEDMIGLGFSARHWQQVEAGRPITVTTLLRACDVLGLRASTLMAQAERSVRPGRRKPRR